MKKIGQNIYKLFLKHGSECLWISDAVRFPRPKGTSIETDEMINVLEAVDHRLQMIASNVYSSKMVSTFQKEIEALKSKILEDVFESMKKIYL
jgi:hypothetical protein